MARSRLAPLQRRVVGLLSKLDPAPVLTGGAALAGFTVDTIQRAPSFHCLRVLDGKDVCIVDLVADPVPAVEPPQPLLSDGEPILVDSRHEILVNTLTALLSRSEARDLDDIRALLEDGGDLRLALRDAPRKDGGFSPLSLAWVLQGFRAGAMALSLGWPEEAAQLLDRFRETLIETLLVEARPPA